MVGHFSHGVVMTPSSVGFFRQPIETRLTRIITVWDSRNLRKALHVSPTPLKVLYPETNAIFSPDEKYIVTGCAASSKSTRGKLSFLKREGLEEFKSIDCAEGESVVKVVWHSKINQVRIYICDGDTAASCAHYSMHVIFVDCHGPIDGFDQRALLAEHVPERS